MGAMERITIDVSVEIAEAMRRSVENGHYASASAIMDELLHDWSQARHPGESELEHLRRLIDEGDASGPSIPAEEVYAELEAIISSYEQER